jgi:hypothetical protein
MMEIFDDNQTPTTTPVPQLIITEPAAEIWSGYEPRWTTTATSLVTETTTISPRVVEQVLSSSTTEALKLQPEQAEVGDHYVQTFSNLTQELVDRFMTALNNSLSTTESPVEVQIQLQQNKDLVS